MTTTTKERKTDLPTDAVELEAIVQLGKLDGIEPEALAARLKLSTKGERERLQEIVGAMRARRRSALSRRSLLDERFEAAYKAAAAKFAPSPRGRP